MIGLCRLCASLKKPDALVTVKDDSNDISDKLLKCCQMDILMKDALPKSVCQECLAMLDVSYKFYTRVHEAQETLLALLPGCGADRKRENTALIKQIDSKKPLLNKYQTKSNSKVKVEIVVGKTVPTKQQQQQQHQQRRSPGKQKETAVESVANDNDGYLEEVYSILGMSYAESAEEKALETSFKPSKQNTSLYEEDDHQDFEIIAEEYPDSNAMVIKSYNSAKRKQSHINEKNMLADIEDGGIIELHGDILDDNEEEYRNTPHERKIFSWNTYPFICYVCEYIAGSVKDLLLHADQEHGINDPNKMAFKCYFCLEHCERYNEFLNHVRNVHQPALRLRCDACDTQFLDKRQYNKHRNACPEAKGLPSLLACNVCGKVLGTVLGLKAHLRKHAALAKEEEQINQENKAGKSNMKDGIVKVKSEGLIYKCDACEKSFKSYSLLEKHKIVHSVVKPHACDYCDRCFRTKVEKVSHERVHTGESPFQCAECGKRFKFRSALAAHSKTHTGMRCYKCEYCSRDFADISNWRKHVRRKHEAEERKVKKEI